jgi:hypothetical protein
MDNAKPVDCVTIAATLPGLVHNYAALMREFATNGLGHLHLLTCQEQVPGRRFCSESQSKEADSNETCSDQILDSVSIYKKMISCISLAL